MVSVVSLFSAFSLSALLKHPETVWQTGAHTAFIRDHYLLCLAQSKTMLKNYQTHSLLLLLLLVTSSVAVLAAVEVLFASKMKAIVLHFLFSLALSLAHSFIR